MRRTLAVAASLTLLTAAACGGDPPAPPPTLTAEDLIASGPHDIAVIEVRDYGSIHIELLPELAPKSVASFKKLAQEDFYAGTTFHRIIPNFMIQGGDPNSRDNDPRNDGEGGPAFTVPDEFSELPHERGVVSMANRGSIDTGGSQFFIVLKESPHLNGGYSAFGRVVKGMDVVDRIAEVERDVYGRYGPNDRPFPKDVVMERVQIEPAASEHAATP